MRASSMSISPLRVMLPSAPRVTVRRPDAFASAMSLSMIRKRLSSSWKLEPDPCFSPIRPLPLIDPPAPSTALKLSTSPVVSSKRLARATLSRRTPVALSRKLPCCRSSRPLRRGSAMEPAMVARALTWPDSERSPPASRSQIGWIWPWIETSPDMSRVRTIASRSGAADASTGRVMSAIARTASPSAACAWMRRVLLTSRALSVPSTAIPRGASTLRMSSSVMLADPDRSSPAPRSDRRPVTRPRMSWTSEPRSTLVRLASMIAARES